MGVFVFLPLVLPFTAWPTARLAEHRLHPRTATRLLLHRRGPRGVQHPPPGPPDGHRHRPTARNPLPDARSDREVCDAVPYDEVAGMAAVPGLLAVLPDDAAYAYALPVRRDRIVVSSGMLAELDGPERRALFAHERAHLSQSSADAAFTLFSVLRAAATPL